MGPEGEDRPQGKLISRHDLGRSGEEAAAEYLTKAGYEIIETRFRLLRGEVDIIARDGGTLVFVEVKTRTGDGFGRPEEAVTPAKQRQIKRIALGYVISNYPGEIDCRFDVIAIDIMEDPDEGILVHFKDAFR